MSNVEHNRGYNGASDLQVSDNDKTLSNVVRNDGHNEWVLRGLHASM
jgi:hypothetical protein